MPAWLVLVLFLLGVCVSDAMSKAPSPSVERLNQEGMGREVLHRSNVEPMQKLADSQQGSTVHRFTPEEVEERLHKHSPPFPGLLSSSFIIEESERETRSQHASTITEVEPGVFVAAWFGGTWERMGDVGIWSARYKDGKWGAAQQLAKPLMDETYPGWMAACYNPVLLHVPHLNTTLLFFKVCVPLGSNPLPLACLLPGALPHTPRAPSVVSGLTWAAVLTLRGLTQVGVNPKHWRGYIMRSPDGGVTWSEAAPLEPGILGPTKNPPFILSDGTILSPSSDEQGEWTSHVEVSKDDGFTWKREPDLHFGQGIIQPSMFRTLDGTLHMVKPCSAPPPLLLPFPLFSLPPPPLFSPSPEVSACARACAHGKSIPPPPPSLLPLSRFP